MNTIGFEVRDRLENDLQLNGCAMQSKDSLFHSQQPTIQAQDLSQIAGVNFLLPCTIDCQEHAQ